MTETTLWITVLIAAAACFALKLAGHLIPEHWLAEERVARTASLVTAALLSALVAVQAVGGDRAITVDARLPALAVAALALALRAPFIVVVILAAAVAAGLRAAGWG